MDILWAIIVIFVIFFILFAVLPSLVRTTPTVPVHAQTPAPTPSTPAERRKEQTAASRAMLDAQYINARTTVPENYPRKPIGDCPYSKAPSTDIPLPNVPMCVAVQPQNMRLKHI